MYCPPHDDKARACLCVKALRSRSGPISGRKARVYEVARGSDEF